MTKMQAARWHNAKDVRVEEVDIPEVGPGQMKVAVAYTCLLYTSDAADDCCRV